VGAVPKDLIGCQVKNSVQFKAGEVIFCDEIPKIFAAIVEEVAEVGVGSDKGKK